MRGAWSGGGPLGASVGSFAGRRALGSTVFQVAGRLLLLLALTLAQHSHLNVKEKSRGMSRDLVSSSLNQFC